MTTGSSIFKQGRGGERDEGEEEKEKKLSAPICHQNKIFFSLIFLYN